MLKMMRAFSYRQKVRAVNRSASHREEPVPTRRDWDGLSGGPHLPIFHRQCSVAQLRQFFVVCNN